MLAALLDPHAIQWLLMLGGGLMVLGIVIWLASLGIFQNPLAVATLLGVGSLATLAGGCFIALRTRFETAGRALAFLGCVVLPLNLWYYEHQGMLTVDGHLWVAAFVICWLYVATVFLLRDAIFVVAVEVGVTLTTLLLMASLGKITDATYLSLTLMVLALISIHSERAFSPDSVNFPRKRFGLAIFWSGHFQLAAGLVILAMAQSMRFFVESTGELLGIRWTGIAITESTWLAASLWLAGAYAYLYSDLVVRRIGVYTYLAGLCLMLAGVTIVGLDVAGETLILLMNGAAVIGVLLGRTLRSDNNRFQRTLSPTSLVLSFLALGMGALLHTRATSHVIAEMGWAYDTGWYYAGAMAVAALINRLLAYLERSHDRQTMSAYLFLSAGAALLSAAGVLRNLELKEWHQQAPALMLLPIGYMFASNLRIERSVRGPLQAIAHLATAIIMLAVAGSTLEYVQQTLLPVSGRKENLIAGLVFVEAVIFYSLAAWIRRKEANYYLATIAACAAIWELIGYADLPSAYYTLLYAVLGVVLLATARAIGVSAQEIFNRFGPTTTRAEGAGRPLYLIANSLIVVAGVAAMAQGLIRLLGPAASWEHLTALILTTVASLLATLFALRGPERWWHATSTAILAALTFMTFHILIDLPLWRKAELFAVVGGLAVLIVSYIARFREEKPSDLVSVGLWLGSFVTAIALIATVYHQGIMKSPIDDVTLLTITILMLASGASLRLKAPTLMGGSILALYLATVVVNLAYRPQVAIGVYLAIGGCLLFAAGVALSVCRERLLELPDRVARREGIFKIISWR
jgi:hypothetical protein